MATYSSILAWNIPWTGAWWAAVHGVAKNQTYLSDCAFTYCTDVHSDYWTNVT